jgi:LacI family transcriptional regulator
VFERFGFGSQPEAIVGLVVPDFRNPFFVELAESLESRLAQYDIQLVIATSNDYERREDLHIKWMIGMRAAGVFYCQNPPFKKSLLTLTNAAGLSVVLIDIERDIIAIGQDKIDTVLADSSAGIERAVAHLAIENQHERIGFLAGPKDSSTAKARLKAFGEAMQEHGLGKSGSLILKGDYTFESGKRAAIELAKLKRQGSPTPSAIVSANDLMAIGLIKGLGQIASEVVDLRVPDRVSVVGFDNIATSIMITPELTSIDQRINEIAERAVRLMTRRIKAADSDEDLSPETERVLPVLIPRQSVSRYVVPSED